MHPLDRGAHRGHHQSADGSDQRRQHHQAGFMGANDAPQPARRLDITGGGDHLPGPSAAERCRQPRFSGLDAGHAIRLRTGAAADKAANALHNPVTLPVVCHLTLLRSKNGGQERYLNARVSQGGWPVLVLNADFRPLSYYPLSLWSWQDAEHGPVLLRATMHEETKPARG